MAQEKESTTISETNPYTFSGWDKALDDLRETQRKLFYTSDKKPIVVKMVIPV